MPDTIPSTAGLAQVRAGLGGYTVDSVRDLVGLSGVAALDRGDLAGVARALRRVGDEPLATISQLFLLGRPTSAAAARAALGVRALAAAVAAGLVVESAGEVRALVEIRPYAEEDVAADDWLVVSDFGADVRPGPLPADHVLGIGAASLTLAGATPRLPVRRALDLGTGCGVQALHLAGHAGTVVATDLSARALRLAATTAALSGLRWQLRAGSLLAPVAGETFDLVVANPPFVVSDGRGGYDYRDSGLAGDGCSAALVRGLPAVLADGGSAHLLANWVLDADGDWRERVSGWLAAAGCDAWVWQREVADPAEYVALWLRDSGLTPRDDVWAPRYDAWLDWFAEAGVLGVGMGVVSLWQGGRDDPVRVLEDVPQALAAPAGAVLSDWIRRQRWLADTDDAHLLDAQLRPDADLVRERAELLSPHGWRPATDSVRQSHGMRWTLDTDEHVAGFLAACASEPGSQVRTAVALLAATLGRSSDEVAAALLPVVRDLVGRGLLTPAETA